MTTHAQPQTFSPSGVTQSRESAADILDNLGSAVLAVDRNGMIRYRNTMAVTWLSDGAQLAEALAEARFLADFNGWSEALARVFDADEALRFEGALRLPGTPTPVLVSVRCMPLRERNSRRITDAIVVIEEEPRQQAVDERFEVSTRLASLGKLATRVAHELNNPLDGILRYINLALRVADDAPGSKLRSYLSESRTGLIRMVQIIGELLEFSRTTDGEFDGMNVNEVVEQAIKNVSAAADAGGIVVAADFQSSDMPSVRGSRVYQVLCNLLKNAIDAMPDGGRLSITTGLVGDQIVIRVADTGMGFSEPVEKLFEPFFTTKEPGKGTGLGLAICRDFVEEMQGTITAAAGEECGAVFTVRIPVSSCCPSSPFVSGACRGSNDAKEGQ